MATPARASHAEVSSVGKAFGVGLPVSPRGGASRLLFSFDLGQVTLPF